MVSHVPDRKPPYKLLSSLRRDLGELKVLGLASGSQWHSREQALVLRVLRSGRERASRPNVLFVLAWNTQKNSACFNLLITLSRTSEEEGAVRREGWRERVAFLCPARPSKGKPFAKIWYISDWGKHVTLSRKSLWCFSFFLYLPFTQWILSFARQSQSSLQRSNTHPGATKLQILISFITNALHLQS